MNERLVHRIEIGLPFLRWTQHRRIRYLRIDIPDTLFVVPKRRLGLFWKTILLLTIAISVTISPAANAVQSCDPAHEICRVEKLWTASDLLNRIDPLELDDYTFILDEDGLTFVLHRADSDDGSAALFWTNIEFPLNRVEDSDYWTVTMQLEGIEEAIVSFGFTDGSRFVYPYATFYGPDAPPSPPVNDTIAGQIETVRFESEALGETRQLSIYLPPDHNASNEYPTIYMTDGEILPGYVAGIDYLITDNIIPPIIVSGAESAPTYRGRHLRGEEYVIGRNPELFEKHAQFFTEEVRLWAEETLGATTDRRWRGIFGVSNGGLFAITMTVQHPDLYGFVFPLSAGAGSGFERSFVVDEETIQLPLYVYSTAGALEPVFLETTLEFAQVYEDAGQPLNFRKMLPGMMMLSGGLNLSMRCAGFLSTRQNRDA